MVIMVRMDRMQAMDSVAGDGQVGRCLKRAQCWQ